MSGWQIGSYFSLFCFCINYHLFYHEYLHLLDLMYIRAENYTSFKRSDNCISPDATVSYFNIFVGILYMSMLVIVFKNMSSTYFNFDQINLNFIIID